MKRINYNAKLGEIKASGVLARLFHWSSIKKDIDDIIIELENINPIKQLEIMDVFAKTANTLTESMKEESNRMKEIEYKASSIHEEKVKKECDAICKSMNIKCYHKKEYPYGLEPDNAVEIDKICFIFDAKSPKENSSVDSFEKTIKVESKNAKKYIGENTATIIYLVVPGHTLHIFDKYSLQEDGYEVRIISIDSLRTEIEHIRQFENHQLKIIDDKTIKIIANTAYVLKSTIRDEKKYREKMIGIIREIDELPKDILEKINDVEKRTPGANNRIISIKDAEKSVDDIEKMKKQMVN